MAFKLGDLLVDRIVLGVAENSQGQLLYTLTNLQEATIDITADSTDVVDGTGAVIKTFYRGKQGTLTATNSTLNLPIIASMGGTDAQIASAENAINMPRIITVEAGKTAVLTGYSGDGSDIAVNEVGDNGSMGVAFQVGDSASATAFAVSGTTFTPPTAEGVKSYIVKYTRSVTDGAYIVNKADAFPKSIKLTLKILIVDPCDPDVVRAAYFVAPNFQPSAEVSINLSTEGTIDYSGVLNIVYCATQKILYEIYVAADDEEEE